jgi:4-amino-4-deoxy-L-arabinose transferase-like glycosyltransferase
MGEVYGQSNPEPRPPHPSGPPGNGEPDRPEPVEGEVVEGEVVEVRRRGPAGAAGDEDFFAEGMGGFGGIPRIPRWRYRPSSVLGALSLVLLCLLVFLPGIAALPVVDRDEARFAQASRQMLESIALPAGTRDLRPLEPLLDGGALRGGYHTGGLLIPMHQDRPRLNKPPLIYWAQVASALFFTRGNPYRDAIWMYRVPSLLAGIATVLLVYSLGLRMFDRRTGWLAAALLAVSPVIAWETHQARADVLLLFLTTLAMWALWTCFAGEQPSRDPNALQSKRRRASPRTAAILWIALGLGILTKGPITPLVVMLTAITLSILSRQHRWLLDTRPLIGVPLLALIVAPWVWAVGEKVGWDFYLSTIGAETLGRIPSPREGHWGPPGYHTILLPVLFWPGSLLTAAGIALAWRAARGGGGRTGKGVLGRLRWHLDAQNAHPYAFCLAWILPAWIIFELISTKLPHYTMPLYPAIALLSARAVLAAQAGALGSHSRGARIGFGIWLGIWIALVALAAVGMAYRATVVPNSFFGIVGKLFTLGLVFLAAMYIRHAIRWWRDGKPFRVQLAGVFAAIVLAILCIGFIAPTLNKLPRELREQLHQIDPQQQRPLAAAWYHEDSLVFTTRGRIDRIAEDHIREWGQSHPHGLLILPTERILRSHVPRAEAGGVNFAKGRFEQLSIVQWFRPEPAP